MQTVWAEVCLLSFYFGGRKEGWGVEVWRWRGVLPDSLEPASNSLIETEWDVLITPVVKTKGGGWRDGRMSALISESEGVWCPPINTDQQSWGGLVKLSQDQDQDQHRPPPALWNFYNTQGFTLSLRYSAAMRGDFSIEWMAQSSQPVGTETASASGPGPGPGPAACGTHSESLPGFYCRQKAENSPEQQESRSQDLDAFSLQHQTSHSNQGTFSPNYLLKYLYFTWASVNTILRIYIKWNQIK